MGHPWFLLRRSLFKVFIADVLVVLCGMWEVLKDFICGNEYILLFLAIFCDKEMGFR